MKTGILSLDPRNVGRREVERIARTMKRGGLVVFPTDTFYGLGGDGLSRAVIGRVYELKRRDHGKPLLVLVSGVGMVGELADRLSPDFLKVAGAFWPGPLTMVLRASFRVPAELGGGRGTVAVRQPDVVWLQDLVRAAGFPVIATSANISGEGEISSADRAVSVFQGKVDLIVDGGEAPGGKASTVLDMTTTPPSVLREGAVPKALLLDLLEGRLS